MKPPPIVNKLQQHVALNPLHGTAALHKAASTPGAQRLVALLESSTSHKSSGFAQVLSQYLHDRLAAGETPDDFVAALKDRAEHEVRKRRRLVQCGQALARRLKDPVQTRRFVSDIVVPAQRGEIDGSTAYSRTGYLLGAFSPELVSMMEGIMLDTTVAISVGAVAGMLVGGEKTIGVAFHGQPPNVKAFQVRSRAVQLGTVEVSASLQFEFSVGIPNSTPLPIPDAINKPGFRWGGWAMGVGIGGGDGVTGEFSVAFTPDFTKALYEWAFNSLSVEIGVGEGASIGVFLQGSVLKPMRLLRKNSQGAPELSY